ncbi:threonylcarbamoyl-AMP synthase [Pedobacter sp. SD-b]|uniref:L-threonylcarbamoyladenylate synthase n=1 Tax=Pedobacter segetis TaxID=2793069 RepID=A0ABS1BK99_9SPHI|nr:L-threonylcarbamoyladenylate synthase [Pedobacter segetis]MBK0383228.1 threonylcarbamoyl-AMP synthase [Pedobacter segetis]
MLKEEINKALEVLKAGGIIVFPTDTAWGLGCDATNEEAVAKIFALKKRVDSKSLIFLIDTENKLQSYVSEIPDVAYDLIEYTEKPLTIIYDGAKNLAKNLINEDGSVAIRIPKHDFCEQLIQRFRKPIVSTSPNISGEPTPFNFFQISDEILNGVDYVVDLEQESTEEKQSSTIIKLGAAGQFAFIKK